MADTQANEPQTAMMLTDTEWRLLADVCKAFLGQSGIVEETVPEHARIAKRIIEAARW